jgi:hypothetical protein
MAAVAAAVFGLMAAPLPSFAAATFVCHGLMNQVCHFSILHLGESRTDFTLRRGESRQVDEASARWDRYMVTVNASPPEHAENCSRNPSSGKRSTWCKLSPVSDGTND